MPLGLTRAPKSDMMGLWARNSVDLEYPVSTRSVAGSNPAVPVSNIALLMMESKGIL